MSDQQPCDRCDKLHERVEQLEQRVESLNAPTINVQEVNGDLAGESIAKTDDRWLLWIAVVACVFVIAWVVVKLLGRAVVAVVAWVATRFV